MLHHILNTGSLSSDHWNSGTVRHDAYWFSCLEHDTCHVCSSLTHIHPDISQMKFTVISHFLIISVTQVSRAKWFSFWTMIKDTQEPPFGKTKYAATCYRAIHNWDLLEINYHYITAEYHSIFRWEYTFATQIWHIDLIEQFWGKF